MCVFLRGRAVIDGISIHFNQESHYECVALKVFNILFATVLCKCKKKTKKNYHVVLVDFVPSAACSSCVTDVERKKNSLDRITRWRPVDVSEEGGRRSCVVFPLSTSISPPSNEGGGFTFQLVRRRREHVD